MLGSGCARLSAVEELIMLDKNRKGEDEMGELSTLTRCADGVDGVTSTGLSNRR